MMGLNVITLNVNGMRTPEKQPKIFKLFENLKNTIIFLQETHYVEEIDGSTWEEKWQGKSLWAGSSAHSSGVAILFSPDINVELSNINLDKNGRYIICTVKLGKQTLTLINIYAPNPPDARQAFFNKIYNKIPSNTKSYLMSGDFNMVEDIFRDREGGNPLQKHSIGSTELGKINQKTNSEDVWLHCNPENSGFTWFSADSLISSRLDRVYLSKHLLDSVIKIETIGTPLSDHVILKTSLNISCQQDRGPGYWKLNTSILDEPFFIEELESFWSYWRSQLVHYSFNEWWDIGKKHIADVCIQYSRSKSKAIKTRISLINNLISQERNSSTPDTDRINELLSEMQSLTAPNVKGAQIRSKLRPAEKFEVPNHYFDVSIPKT